MKYPSLHWLQPLLSKDPDTFCRNKIHFRLVKIRTVLAIVYIPGDAGILYAKRKRQTSSERRYFH